MKCIKNFCKKEATLTIHHRTFRNNNAHAYCDEHIPEIMSIEEAKERQLRIEYKDEKENQHFFARAKGT